MAQTMTYDELYKSLAKRFIVENKHNSEEYNLGDFMLMKAQNRKDALVAAANNESNLPTLHEKTSNAIVSVFAYVNDKLTVKEAPIRDKTIRSFPLRTSFSAFSSALVVCALVISCCAFAISSITTPLKNIVSTETEIEENLSDETILI